MKAHEQMKKLIGDGGYKWGNETLELWNRSIDALLKQEINSAEGSCLVCGEKSDSNYCPNCGQRLR